MNQTLIVFREIRNWKQADIALKLCISLEEYIRLEIGVACVSSEIARKLSDIYAAPKEVFLDSAPPYSILFSNCNFYGGNGYVNNQNQNRDQYDKEIEKLQFEVLQLKQRYEKLAELFGI
jgi:hypothetical protein